jgi:hypothetical protein
MKRKSTLPYSDPEKDGQRLKAVLSERRRTGLGDDARTFE